MAKRGPKPLWGFGWAGWCLLGVAVTLGAMMFAGVDIRYWIMSRIHHNLGWDATVWCTTVFIPSHLLFDLQWMSNGIALPLSPPMMRFSLVTMCLVLVALQVHPRRTGILRIGGVVAMGVMVPGLTLSALLWLTPLWQSAPGSRQSAASSITVFAFVSAALSGLALMRVTRSWRMGILSAGFFVLGAYMVSEESRGMPAPGPLPPLLMSIRGNETWFTTLAWLWNPMLFACLMVWAVRARQRVRPEHCCQECGYDLRATPEGKCPECGSARIEESLLQEAVSGPTGHQIGR